MLKAGFVQALEIMETLIIPGSEKVDVRDKEEVCSSSEAHSAIKSIVFFHRNEKDVM
jgi:hypothetical protein